MMYRFVGMLKNDILQSFQKEQELNRLKNQFIQLTSHEFRTPMASIYTSMDVMKHHLEAMILYTLKIPSKVITLKLLRK